MQRASTVVVLALMVGYLVSGTPVRAEDDCEKKYRAETKPLTDQYLQLDKKIHELISASAKAKTGAEQEAAKEQINGLKKQQESLRKQVDEATKRMVRCAGLPVTKEEARQREAEMKARTAKQTEEMKRREKEFEAYRAASQGKNMGGGAGAGGSNSSGNPSTPGNSSGFWGASQGLIPMPPVPDTPPPASSSSSMPSLVSGRTKQQRDAALSAVNAELERLPLVLPKKENAPSKTDVLKIASARNAEARKSFSPEELMAYSKTVTWVPRFDGASPNAGKAREYSIAVAAANSHFDKPRFVIALGTAVFSLDPGSVSNSNNLASAIVRGGELLHPDNAQAKELALYRKDAESCFLYAMAISMKDDAWTDNSLTAILNLGNLYIDMNRLDEARSLFQVARKLKPFSWDAALGMAAYFHAVNKPDKAIAILEDDNLDKPVTLMVARKSSKVLEKSDAYAELPLESPEEKYEKGIEIMNSEPIATAADFVAQLDQSERNRMRRFVENLPPKGSFTAPSIKKLTQYASLKAISAPPGISALKDFAEMLQMYSLSSFASLADEQLKMLSNLGLNISAGVDLNDVARNPEKYVDSKKRPNAKIDKAELMANLEKLRKQAKVAERELAAGRTTALREMAAEVDPFFAILLLDPQDYADPVNIIIQKHNFAVHNRKVNLYNGYLYSVNRKTRRAFDEIVDSYQRKISTAERIQADELAKLEKSDASEAELALLKHAVHVRYFNTCNAAAETAYGSATNVATVAYVQKIKPKVEAFYYDVIRHVGLITDPEVRDWKDSELRRAIHSALAMALNNVGAAHGSFKYHPEWECECDVGQLLAQREVEQEARKDEENARIMRNKAAKVAFDSGEIPESTPLWKKLDSYVADLNIPFLFFLSGRVSCARTWVRLDTKALPIPNLPQLFGSMTRSEFTGATKYEGGVTVALEAFKSDYGSVGANLGLSGSVSTDGNWNVSDYSVTPGAGLSVKVGKTGVSVGEIFL